MNELEMRKWRQLGHTSYFSKELDHKRIEETRVVV